MYYYSQRTVGHHHNHREPQQQDFEHLMNAGHAVVVVPWIAGVGGEMAAMAPMQCRAWVLTLLATPGVWHP